MSKRKEQVEIVEIRQVQNGYTIMVGSNCQGIRELYVFQTFAELTVFLSEHFTHRQDDIEEDSYSSLND